MTLVATLRRPRLLQSHSESATHSEPHTHPTISTGQARPAAAHASFQSLLSPSRASSSTRGSKTLMYSSTAGGRGEESGRLQRGGPAWQQDAVGPAAHHMPAHAHRMLAALHWLPSAEPGTHELAAPSSPVHPSKYSREEKLSGICSLMSAAPAAWQAECHRRPPRTSFSNLRQEGGRRHWAFLAQRQQVARCGLQSGAVRAAPGTQATPSPSAASHLSTVCAGACLGLCLAALGGR